MSDSDDLEDIEDACRAALPRMLNDGSTLDEIIRAAGEYTLQLFASATEAEANESLPEGMELPKTAAASVLSYVLSEEFMSVFAELQDELGEDWAQQLRTNSVAEKCFRLGRLLDRVQMTLTGETDRFIQHLENAERARTIGSRNAKSDEQLSDQAEKLTKIFWEVAKGNPTLKMTYILELMIEMKDSNGKRKVPFTRVGDLRKSLSEYAEWPPLGWKEGGTYESSIHLGEP